MSTETVTVSNEAAKERPVVAFVTDSLFSIGKKLLTEKAAIDGKGLVSVRINGQDLEYPASWLRFRCQCKKCFDPSSLSYLCKLEMLHGDGVLQIQDISVAENGKSVDINWKDGHQSNFTSDWLYIRRFTNSGVAEREKTLAIPKAKQWPQDVKEMAVQKGTYAEVTETLEGFQHFGESLARDGIFLITDSPDRKVDREFCDKIGSMLMETHFKNYTVEYKPNAFNLTYSNVKLELHVDLPYMVYCPKIQYLHCITPAEVGGDSVMADGMKAANLLKERAPEDYKILRDMNVSYEDIVATQDQMHQYIFNTKKVINENEAGEPEYLQYNTPTLSSYFNGTTSAAECDRWMKALLRFQQTWSECSVNIKMDAGDIIAFDNRRVMHGREVFQTPSRRKLETFFSDFDYIYSRLRVARILLSSARRI